MASKESNIQVYDAKGKKVNTVKLNADIFTGDVNKGLLHQVVVGYLANKRSGTASTKTRADVSGGGKKPWRQKGTGRARVGSSRNPVWRGGGVAFGPKPRDFSQQLPKKMRQRALQSALNVKVQENALHLVNEFVMDSISTKTFDGFLKKLGITGKVLVVLDAPNPTVVMSARNIKKVTIDTADNINALQILHNDHCVCTQEAFEQLQKRCVVVTKKAKRMVEAS